MLHGVVRWTGPVRRVRAQRFLLVADCLHESALLRLIQPVQLGHVVVVELEAVEVGVAGDSGWCVALGQRDEASLQTPAYEHLGVAHVVLLCNGVQCLVLCLLVADERAVCFDDDVVLLAVFDGVLLLAPGVELDCVSEVHTTLVDLDVPRFG